MVKKLILTLLVAIPMMVFSQERPLGITRYTQLLAGTSIGTNGDKIDSIQVTTDTIKIYSGGTQYNLITNADERVNSDSTLVSFSDTIILRGDTLDVENKIGLFSRLFGRTGSLFEADTGKFNNFSLSDNIVMDSTRNFVDWFEEYEFDSIGTKQLRITDSVLIIEDLPNRFEDQRVYYNPSTGKISYNEIISTYGAFSDSLVTIPLSSSDTYYQITNGDSLFRVLKQNGITWIEGDTLQLSYDGIHKFEVGLMAIGDDTEIFRMRIYNVTQSLEIPIGYTNIGQNTNNYLVLSGVSYCTFCEAGDKIIMQVQDIGLTDDGFQVISAYIYVERE